MCRGTLDPSPCQRADRASGHVSGLRPLVAIRLRRCYKGTWGNTLREVAVMPQNAEAPTSAPWQETILIVDDEEPVRKTFREWLEEANLGCRLFAAADAESALSLANRQMS